VLAEKEAALWTLLVGITFTMNNTEL